jgi:hypothetical protein
VKRTNKELQLKEKRINKEPNNGEAKTLYPLA